MKSLLLLILLISAFSEKAQAETAVFCSLYHAKRVISLAEQHSRNDKNRHCSVSCMLTLKCDADEVMLVGLLKEFKDLLGAGDADEEDLKADALGINLAVKRAARTDQQCLSQCDLYYPR